MGPDIDDLLYIVQIQNNYQFLQFSLYPNLRLYCAVSSAVRARAGARDRRGIQSMYIAATWDSTYRLICIVTGDEFRSTQTFGSSPVTDGIAFKKFVTVERTYIKLRR